MGGLEKVIARIRPRKGAELKEQKFVHYVLDKLSSELKSAKVVLAGSFAKGTFLEGDKDIDVFVLFSHSIEKEAMEAIVRAAVENAFPKAFIQVAYAQHPYVRLFLKDRKIDVVPAYEIAHGRHFELKTAVDRSQLHTEYILRKMSEKQKDEVRLLKKFLKVHGLYGAEIKVQGFSGYLCELLVLNYGSFENAMKSISQWKERTFIDIESHMEQSVGFQKFTSPLVVIDPVDPERNVSAVVNSENYYMLIALARSFINSKNKLKFFEKKKLLRKQLASFVKNRILYCIEFKSPNVIDDVLWGQVRRFYSTLAALLRKEGFELIGNSMDKSEENVQVLFEVLNEPLPEYKLIFGPPLQFEKDCEKFVKQYKDSFVLGNRIVAKVKRSERTILQFLPKIKNLPLPSHLSSIKNAKLYKGIKLIKRCREILENYARRFL